MHLLLNLQLSHRPFQYLRVGEYVGANTCPRILISSNAIAYEVIKIQTLSYSDHIQGLIKNSLGEKNSNSIICPEFHS